VERPARDKHSSLLVTFVNSGRKKCYDIGPRMGVPFSRIICASNSNKILTDFFKTGTYDLRNLGYKKLLGLIK
jgi:threonine synthase